MNGKKWIILFIFSVSLSHLYAQDEFDFAFNLGNFGWGMNLSPDKKEGHFTYNLFNLYIQHLKSHIGVEISPFNSWVNYRHTDIQMNFINIKLFYNLLVPGEYYEEYIEDSNFMLAGPFVSLNYLRLGNNQPLNTNNVQVNIGLKLMVMFDFSFFFQESSLPIGLQLFNVELGYRFNNYVFNNHQFYFNLSTDILALVSLIGIFSEEPEEIKQQKNK